MVPPTYVMSAGGRTIRRKDNGLSLANQQIRVFLFSSYLSMQYLSFSFFFPSFFRFFYSLGLFSFILMLVTYKNSHYVLKGSGLWIEVGYNLQN